MANYTEKELLTVVKSYSRANPLAIDSTALWGSQGKLKRMQSNQMLTPDKLSQQR